MNSKPLTPDASLPNRLAFIPSFSRIKPALLHFLISLTIFSVLLAVITLIWYPTPFFTASGGWEGIRLVAFVDIVLGPVLTLAVSNPSKARKALMGDMSVIIAAQLLALGFGIFTVYNQRPVAIVFWEDAFYAVEAKDLTQQHYDLAQLSAFDSGSPPYIYAEKPASVEGKLEMVELIREKNLPPFSMPELYRPLDKAVIEEQQMYEVNINGIITRNPDMKKQLDRVLQAHHLAMADAHYFVLKSRYHNIVIVFNADRERIGYLSAPLK